MLSGFLNALMGRCVSRSDSRGLDTASRHAIRRRAMNPARRRLASPWRLQALEDRTVPATFAEIGTTLNLDLAASDAASSVSNGSSYTLTLAAGNWAGTD